MDNGMYDSNNPSAGHLPISDAVYQELAEMIGLDMPELMVDLLDTYLEESNTLVESISTLGRTDLSSPTVMRAAHSLKSTSASVGAMSLSALCGDLEIFLRGIGDDLDVETHIQWIEQEHARVNAELAVRRDTLLNN